jgi:hypothetical protein
MPDQELDSLLSFDGLRAAEKVSGKTYKEDEPTAMLGMFMSIDNNKKLAEQLKARSDTHFGVKYPWFLKRLAEEGFEEAAKYPAGDTDTLYVHVKRDEGLVIVWDTYGDGINIGNVMFNLEFNECEKDTWLSKCSGGFARCVDKSRRIYVGDYDIREALFYKLNEMRRVGKFLPVWVERPWKKILSYVDWKMARADYKALHEQRMAALPTWLKNIMGNDNA